MKTYTLAERLLLTTAGFEPAEVNGEKFVEADEALLELSEKSTPAERKAAAKAMAKKRKSSAFRNREQKLAKKRVGKTKDIARVRGGKIGARHRT